MQHWNSRGGFHKPIYALCLLYKNTWQTCNIDQPCGIGLCYRLCHVFLRCKSMHTRFICNINIKRYIFTQKYSQVPQKLRGKIINRDYWKSYILKVDLTKITLIRFQYLFIFKTIRMLLWIQYRYSKLNLGLAKINYTWYYWISKMILLRIVWCSADNSDLFRLEIIMPQNLYLDILFGFVIFYNTKNLILLNSIKQIK